MAVPLEAATYHQCACREDAELVVCHLVARVPASVCDIEPVLGRFRCNPFHGHIHFGINRIAQQRPVIAIVTSAYPRLECQRVGRCLFQVSGRQKCIA